MVMKRILVFVLMVSLVSACATQSTHAQSLPSPVANYQILSTESAPLPTATQKAKKFSPITPMPTATRTPVLAAIPRLPERDPAKWKTWPVMPESVDPSLQKVYEKGLTLGNDPHAFSIFGDCQERPGDFFGVFETDAELVDSLSPELREVIDNFQG